MVIGKHISKVLAIPILSCGPVVGSIVGCPCQDWAMICIGFTGDVSDSNAWCLIRGVSLALAVSTFSPLAFFHLFSAALFRS